MYDQEALPLAYQGNHWLFLFALFTYMMIVVWSVAAVGSIAAVSRQDHYYWRSALSLSRIGVACLYLAALLRSLGDFTFAYSWGEVSNRTLLMIANADRILDVAAFFPFALGTVALSASRPQVAFHLGKFGTTAVDFYGKADGGKLVLAPPLAQTMKLSLVAFVLAFLVTAHKQLA